MYSLQWTRSSNTDLKSLSAMGTFSAAAELCCWKRRAAIQAAQAGLSGEQWLMHGWQGWKPPCVSATLQHWHSKVNKPHRSALLVGSSPHTPGQSQPLPSRQSRHFFGFAFNSAFRGLVQWGAAWLGLVPVISHLGTGNEWTGSSQYMNNFWLKLMGSLPVLTFVAGQMLFPSLCRAECFGLHLVSKFLLFDSVSHH